MRVQLIVAAACLSAALSGCGTSGGGSPAPGQAVPGGGAGSGDSGSSGAQNPCGATEPGLCTTITITGAVSLQGTFEASWSGGDRIIESCTDYLKGDQNKPRLTLPVALGTKVAGHTIGIANQISRSYQGQGTYDRKNLGAIDGGLHVDIDHTSYQIDDASTAQAEISADGSGKLTFTNLREATNSSDSSEKGVISGNYSWTCHD